MFKILHLVAGLVFANMTCVECPDENDKEEKFTVLVDDANSFFACEEEKDNESDLALAEGEEPETEDALALNDDPKTKEKLV